MAASGSAKLRTFLLADAAVAAIVGTDIVTPRAVGAIVRPSIVFRVVAGPGAGRNPGRQQSFEFRFWSALKTATVSAELSAVTLYETVRSAILPLSAVQETNRAAMRVAGLWLATEEVEGQPLYDPDGPAKDIPYVLGQFLVVFHDE